METLHGRPFRHFGFLSPPRSEQQCHRRIPSDKATAAIDDAISRARRQIELVQEYRTRLIADVVTGKLDVREVAAQLLDESDDEEPFDEDELAEDVDGSPYDAETAEAELTA